MNLNKLRDKAYQCAVAHGWHEENLSNEHFLCLVISELMEAVEADRKGKHAKVAMFKEWQGNSVPLTEETRKRRFMEDIYQRDCRGRTFRCLHPSAGFGWIERNKPVKCTISFSS